MLCVPRLYVVCVWLRARVVRAHVLCVCVHVLSPLHLHQGREEKRSGTLRILAVFYSLL